MDILIITLLSTGKINESHQKNLPEIVQLILKHKVHKLNIILPLYIDIFLVRLTCLMKRIWERGTEKRRKSAILAHHCQLCLQIHWILELSQAQKWQLLGMILRKVLLPSGVLPLVKKAFFPVSKTTKGADFLLLNAKKAKLDSRHII